jgi:hypothetical protein
MGNSKSSEDTGQRKHVTDHAAFKCKYITKIKYEWHV